MIRLYDFDEVKPEEILNRDIRFYAYYIISLLGQ